MKTVTREEWFECRLANDPEFLSRVEKARAAIRAGRGIAWEKVKSGKFPK
jgi:hypothetical protein